MVSGLLQRGRCKNKTPNMPELSFERELENLINKHNKENDSNTPDFILCKYIQDSLTAFTTATRLRDNWYGGAQSPGNVAEKKSWTIS